MPAPVGIVGGTGALGFGLALRLARAGVEVVIGSRDADRAATAAAGIGEGATGAANADCVRAADLVVLCVPFASQAGTLKGLKEALRPEQVLVDATVPLAAAVGGRPTRLLGVPQGSAAEQAQELVPDGVRVVSALHTVSADLLRDLDHALDEDVLVCGDRAEDRARVVALVERIPGLRGVEAGRLETARIVEGLTPLLISINIRHKVRAGIRITGLS